MAPKPSVNAASCSRSAAMPPSSWAGPVAACAQGLQDGLQAGAVKDGRGRIAAKVLPQAQRVGAVPLCPGAEQPEIVLAAPVGPWRQPIHRVHGHQVLQQRRCRWDE